MKNKNTTKSNAMLKTLRKLHTKTGEDYMRVFYWVVEDKNLAEKLGISTKKDDMGDIYIIKECQEGNNISIQGYDYSSKLFMKNSEAINNPVKAMTDMFSIIIGRPTIIEDHFQYLNYKGKVFLINIAMQYAESDILLMMCDSKDVDTLYQLLQNLREEFPYKTSGEINVLFLICPKTVTLMQ